MPKKKSLVKEKEEEEEEEEEKNKRKHPRYITPKRKPQQPRCCITPKKKGLSRLGKQKENEKEKKKNEGEEATNRSDTWNEEEQG